ncbi:MAG: hypothetical protein LC648_10620 [Novosphingobium sp.]|nr:hypothetical protein [Novosphingobium sp.]
MTATIRPRSPLARLGFAAAAILGTALSFGATTAPAHAALSPYYQAQLATPVTGAARDIQNDVAWKCEGDACRGSEGNSRAEVVCARLARKFGEVTAFTVKGEALEPDKLAKCNGDKNAAMARR